MTNEITTYVTNALDPNNPLAPLAAWVGGATALKLLAWMGAFRAVGKLISTKLQEILEAFRVWAKGTASENDDHILDRVLDNPIYRGASFLIDYFFSIKLPQAGPDGNLNRRGAETQSQPSQLATQTAALILIVAAMLMAGCQSPVPGTHFSGAIGGVPFTFDGRKQTSVENLELHITSVTVVATNYSTLRIGKLQSLNDPQVIDKSYAGQAAVAKTWFDGLNSILEKMAAGAAKGLTAKNANHAKPEIDQFSIFNSQSPIPDPFTSPDGHRSNIWVSVPSVHNEATRAALRRLNSDPDFTVVTP